MAATEEILAIKVSINELVDRISKSEKERVFLILLQPDVYPSLIFHLVEGLCDSEDVQGVYVTITLPYRELASILGGKQIASEKILFIDAISKGTVGKVSADNCFFLDGPEDLIQLSITLEKFVKETRMEKTFVLIDSLTVLLVYNSKDLIMKFLHHIVSKLRSYKCKVIFLALDEKEHRTPLKFLSFLSDETFQLIEPAPQEN